jgi:hypothetical protein
MNRKIFLSIAVTSTLLCSQASALELRQTTCNTILNYYVETLYKIYNTQIISQLKLLHTYRLSLG